MKKTKVQTKAEARERKRRKKMPVSGKSVLKISQIIAKKKTST
jgi:hypothetical protein